MDSKIINPNGPALTKGEAQRLRKESGSICTQYIGNPCRVCGACIRMIANGTCKVCQARVVMAAYNSDINAARAKGRENQRKRRRGNPEAVREYERNDANRAARSKARHSAIVTCRCSRCGAEVECTRGMAYAYENPNSGTRYCPNCRPEHLHAVQPDADAWLYVFLIERPGDEHTVFGITADWKVRASQYRTEVRKAGMTMGKAQLVGPMRRDEALQIECKLKALVSPADDLDFCGAKTESLRGDRRAELLRLMR